MVALKNIFPSRIQIGKRMIVADQLRTVHIKTRINKDLWSGGGSRDAKWIFQKKRLFLDAQMPDHHVAILRIVQHPPLRQLLCQIRDTAPRSLKSDAFLRHRRWYR